MRTRPGPAAVDHARLREGVLHFAVGLAGRDGRLSEPDEEVEPTRSAKAVLGDSVDHHAPAALRDRGALDAPVVALRATDGARWVGVARTAA